MNPLSLLNKTDSYSYVLWWVMIYCMLNEATSVTLETVIYQTSPFLKRLPSNYRRYHRLFHTPDSELIWKQIRPVHICKLKVLVLFYVNSFIIALTHANRRSTFRIHYTPVIIIFKYPSWLYETAINIFIQIKLYFPKSSRQLLRYKNFG